MCQALCETLESQQATETSPTVRSNLKYRNKYFDKKALVLKTPKVLERSFWAGTLSDSDWWELLITFMSGILTGMVNWGRRLGIISCESVESRTIHPYFSDRQMNNSTLGVLVPPGGHQDNCKRWKWVCGKKLEYSSKAGGKNEGGLQGFEKTGWPRNETLASRVLVAYQQAPRK